MGVTGARSVHQNQCRAGKAPSTCLSISKAEGARKLIEPAGTGCKATPHLDSDGGYSL